MTGLRVLVYAFALSAAMALADTDRNRADALRHKFMAPCCWSETLAEHHSPAASELNSEIDKWIAAGLSDAGIESRLVGRYGRRILAEPGGAQGTVLRVVPFLALGAGAVWIVFLLRRWMRPAPA
jgi:cytochrome c-type biogenesis protein CcmH